MRVSIRDVARQVGVSHVTVANVLNGRQHKASPETAELVRKAAREMNYIPVAQPATQRRHVETRIIGLVFDHLSWEDYWGLETYRGLQAAAIEHGYDLLTVLRRPARGELSREELSFLDRRSDGYIFMVPENRDETFKTLVDHKIPVVSCYIDDVPKGVASVALDNEGATRMAVEHLLAQGHRRILFIGPDSSRSDFIERRESYEKTMRGNGLQPHVFLAEFSQGWLDGESWMQDVIQLSAALGIAAIVAASDWFALNIHRALMASGKRLPEDISLIGMDNLPLTAEYGITTVRYSCIDVGRLAVESIVRLVKGESTEVDRHLVPVELVQRGTVGPPRS